ncbi:MAG: hypothetical protein J6E31_03625 [Pyramidobacter sp.]|nr:hypothetical protein [Pyramidobacter sp.]
MPKIDLEPVTTRIHIRVTKRDAEKLKKAADEYGISIAELVRRRTLHIPLPRGNNALLKKIDEVLVCLTDIRGALARQGNLFKDLMSRNPPHTREISDLLDVQKEYYAHLCETVKKLARTFMSIIAPIVAKKDEDDEGEDDN